VHSSLYDSAQSANCVSPNINDLRDGLEIVQQADASNPTADGRGQVYSHDSHVRIDFQYMLVIAIGMQSTLARCYTGTVTLKG
jgi:hypothetical protein